MLSLMTEYVWDFQNNALWDTHRHAYCFNTTSLAYVYNSLGQGRIDSFRQSMISIVKSSKKPYFTHKKAYNKVKMVKDAKSDARQAQIPTTNSRYIWGFRVFNTLLLLGL